MRYADPRKVRPKHSRRDKNRHLMPIHAEGYCPYNVATEAYNDKGLYRFLSDDLTYTCTNLPLHREPRVLAAKPCHLGANLGFAGAHGQLLDLFAVHLTNVPKRRRLGWWRHERREPRVPSPVAVRRDARQVRRGCVRIQALSTAATGSLPRHAVACTEVSRAESTQQKGENHW